MAEKILNGGEYLIAETPCEDIFTPEDFTDEQRQMGETTEQFIANEIVPHIEEIDKQNFDLVVEGMKKCGELGLLMMDTPEEYGGLELDKASTMLVSEKAAFGGSFSVAYSCHTGIGTLPLVYYGTAEQKEKYLEKITSGEWCAAYCLTEPGSGSDALGAQASAVLSEDGTHYILNGTKQFITNGGFAELFTVFAKIDKKHFTAFLVEKSFEGLVVGAEEKKLGIKGSSTTQIILDNCKVPVENLLGEKGKGHKIAFNVLNGTKQFITNGGFAEIFTVFAKIDKEHFTAFLVEKSFEGLIVGAEEKKLGIKGSSTTQIILDNCKVPVENLLGEKGKGHKIAFNVLNIGRFKLGAGVTGASKMALADGIKYANERKQFNTPISQFGAISQKIGDLTTYIFAAESLVYRLAGLLDDKIATIEKGIDNYYEEYLKGIEEYASECGISKVFCSEVLAKTVDEVVQIHGGYGFCADYPAERYYRDERINRIFEGTNEINRLLIPGMILRKAMKGELPLQAEAMKAFESLMTPSFEELDESILYVKEKALIKNLKTLFLILSGAGVQKFMDKLVNEQEILMAAADIAIQIFALESVVLRAEKSNGKVSESKQVLMDAAVKIFAFEATENAGRAARQGAFFIEEGDTLTMILSGIRRFAKYDATGLLVAKRTLAKAACEAEKYVF